MVGSEVNGGMDLELNMGVKVIEEASIWDNSVLSPLDELGVWSDKFKTSTEVVKKLSAAWKHFREGFDKGLIQEIDKCFQVLLRHSAKVLFNTKYVDKRKVDEESKSLFVESIQGVRSSLEGFKPFQNVLSSLIALAKDPWADPIFAAVSKAEGDPSLLAIQALWLSEGWLLLEERIETMCKIRMYNTVVKLLHLFVMKGREWFWENLEDVKDDGKFHPYQFSFNQYLSYLHAYSILWRKYPDGTNLLPSLPPHLSVQLIRRLRLPTSSINSVQLLPKLCKANLEEAVPSLAEALVWNALKKDCNLKVIEDLLVEWIDLSLQNVEDSNLNEKMEVLKQQFFRRRSDNVILFSEYGYLFAELILRKVGLNDQTKLIFLELFAATMTDDINMIEIIRTETPCDIDKLDKELRKLSQRELRMAEFFKDYPNTSREFRLTAFSLNPTNELFQALFPEEPASAKIEQALDSPMTESSDAKVIPNVGTPDAGLLDSVANLEIGMPVPEPVQTQTISDNKNINEDLGLPLVLLHDVETLMSKPRWAAVGHYTKGAEQKRLCTELLTKGLEVITKEKELKWVDVDYELYKHLPSKYDPNDDGIEKGYGHNEKSKYGRNGARRVLNQRPRGINLASKSKSKHPGRRGVPGWPKGVPKARGVRPNLNAKILKPPIITAEQAKREAQKEINGRLGHLQQFVYQNENLKDFLKEHADNEKYKNIRFSHFTKAKNLKSSYIASFLKEKKKCPYSFEIDYAKVYSATTGEEISRTQPTGYYLKDTPYHIRIHNVGDFEVSFRTDEQKIAINEWTDIDTAESFSSKIEVKKAISSNKNNPVVVLKEDPGITDVLKRLTRQYNSLKNEALKSSKINKEGSENAINTPTKKWAMIEKENKENVLKSAEGPVSALEYALGEIWEFAFDSREIIIPPMPRARQDFVKKTIMVREAEERLMNNLEQQTYRWECVMQRGVEDQYEEERHTGLSDRIIGPLTEDDQRLADERSEFLQPCPLNGNSALLVDSSKKSGDLYAAPVEDLGTTPVKRRSLKGPKAPKSPKSPGEPVKKGRPAKRKSTAESIEATINCTIINAMLGSESSLDSSPQMNAPSTSEVGQASEPCPTQIDTAVAPEMMDASVNESTDCEAIQRFGKTYKSKSASNRCSLDEAHSSMVLENSQSEEGEETSKSKEGEEKSKSEEGEEKSTSEPPVKEAEKTKVVSLHLLSQLNALLSGKAIDNSPKAPTVITKSILCDKTGEFMDVPKDPADDVEDDLAAQDDMLWPVDGDSEDDTEWGCQDEEAFYFNISPDMNNLPEVLTTGEKSRRNSTVLDPVEGNLSAPEPEPKPAIIEPVKVDSPPPSSRNAKKSITRDPSRSTTASLVFPDCYVKIIKSDLVDAKLAELKAAEAGNEEETNEDEKTYEDEKKNKDDNTNEDDKTTTDTNTPPEPKRSNRIMSKDTILSFKNGFVQKVEKPLQRVCEANKRNSKKRQKSRQCKDTNHSLTVSTHRRRGSLDRKEKLDTIIAITTPVSEEMPLESAKGKENKGSKLPNNKESKSVARKRTCQQSEGPVQKKARPVRNKTFKRKLTRRSGGETDVSDSDDDNVSDCVPSDSEDDSGSDCGAPRKSRANGRKKARMLDDYDIESESPSPGVLEDIMMSELEEEDRLFHSAEVREINLQNMIHHQVHTPKILKNARLPGSGPNVSNAKNSLNPNGNQNGQQSGTNRCRPVQVKVGKPIIRPKKPPTFFGLDPLGETEVIVISSDEETDANDLPGQSTKQTTDRIPANLNNGISTVGCLLFSPQSSGTAGNNSDSGKSKKIVNMDSQGVFEPEIEDDDFNLPETIHSLSIGRIVENGQNEPESILPDLFDDEDSTPPPPPQSDTAIRIVASPTPNKEIPAKSPESRPPKRPKKDAIEMELEELGLWAPDYTSVAPLTPEKTRSEETMTEEMPVISHEKNNLPRQLEVVPDIQKDSQSLSHEEMPLNNIPVPDLSSPENVNGDRKQEAMPDFQNNSQSPKHDEILQSPMSVPNPPSPVGGEDLDGDIHQEAVPDIQKCPLSPNQEGILMNNMLEPTEPDPSSPVDMEDEFIQQEVLDIQKDSQSQRQEEILLSCTPFSDTASPVHIEDLEDDAQQEAVLDIQKDAGSPNQEGILMNNILVPVPPSTNEMQVSDGAKKHEEVPDIQKDSHSKRQEEISLNYIPEHEPPGPADSGNLDEIVVSQPTESPSPVVSDGNDGCSQGSSGIVGINFGRALKFVGRFLPSMLKIGKEKFCPPVSVMGEAEKLPFSTSNCESPSPATQEVMKSEETVEEKMPVTCGDNVNFPFQQEVVPVILEDPQSPSHEEIPLDILDLEEMVGLHAEQLIPVGTDVNDFDGSQGSSGSEEPTVEELRSYVPIYQIADPRSDETAAADLVVEELQTCVPNYHIEIPRSDETAAEEPMVEELQPCAPNYHFAVPVHCDDTVDEEMTEMFREEIYTPIQQEIPDIEKLPRSLKVKIPLKIISVPNSPDPGDLEDSDEIPVLDTESPPPPVLIAANDFNSSQESSSSEGTVVEEMPVIGQEEENLPMDQESVPDFQKDPQSPGQEEIPSNEMILQDPHGPVKGDDLEGIPLLQAELPIPVLTDTDGCSQGSDDDIPPSLDRYDS